MGFFNKVISVIGLSFVLAALFAIPVSADQLTSGYTVSTDVTINNYKLVNNGSYGEGKFYVSPTYTFDDATVLKNGDILVYDVPSVFKFDQALTQNLTAPTGETIATLVTDPATNKATITITNQDYFARLNETKKIQALFTVQWADATPYNVPQTFTFEGAQEYTLTRIVVDEEPEGYSKWGVQDSKDPNIVNWRIRINRDIKQLGNVVITDTIPEGQELEGAISGYYFADWTNGPRTSFTANDPNIVSITDSNHFTINAGDLSNRGIYIIYKTRLTAPVDKVEKKVFNDIVVTSDGNPLQALNYRPFAPLTTVDGVGEGTRSDEAIFKVNKILSGRTLAAGEFSFELVDDATGNVLETVTNDSAGVVQFSKIKFSTVGDFTYTIREKASGSEGVTDDADADIKVSVNVVDNGGAKQVTASYDRDSFTNVYTAPTTTTTTTESTTPTTTTSTTTESTTTTSATTSTTTESTTTTSATTSATTESATTVPTTTAAASRTTEDPKSTTSSKPTTPKKKLSKPGLPSTGDASESWLAILGLTVLVIGGYTYYKRPI
ncbi:Spy0128 family protein [Streptococcus ferus]|uniref:Spy0128 family protein n=1 Tax=Streptococcus ferus TaxID=1345 RepID=UPI00359F6913